MLGNEDQAEQLFTVNTLRHCIGECRTPTVLALRRRSIIGRALVGTDSYRSKRVPLVQPGVRHGQDLKALALLTSHRMGDLMR